MGYRIRYAVNIDFVPPGVGAMSALNAPTLPGGGGVGPTLEVENTPGYTGTVVAGAGTVVVSGKTYQNALNAADITTLTNAMAADTAAQLNVAATLAKLQAWVYGGQ
jgi:hypothetical protein